MSTNRQLTQSDYNGGSASGRTLAERREEERIQAQMVTELREIWALARKDEEPDALIDAFEHKWRMPNVGLWLRGVIAIFNGQRGMHS